MEEERTPIADLYGDISACFLAIANALERSEAVPKSAIAEAAQERLLSLAPLQRPGERERWPMLRALATRLERTENEVPKTNPPE